MTETDAPTPAPSTHSPPSMPAPTSLPGRLVAAVLHVVRRAAKLVSHPVRAYFNGHFEMTKAEIRAAAATHPVSRVSDEAVLEVGNVVAETSIHQARMIGDLRERVDELTTEIEELRSVVQQLTRVVADGLAAAPEPHR